MPVRSDVCEVWQNDRWRPIYVDDALGLAPGSRKRCRECHGPVRAHKHSNNGMGAHFEHLTRHPGCSLGSNWDGSRRPHPDALS